VLSPEIVSDIEAFFEENGELILEAEDGENTAGTTHSWVTQTHQSGYVGSSYLRTLPDSGALANPGDEGIPEVTFPVYITTPTIYRVWARGLAPDAAGDSLHITLENSSADTATNMTGFTNSGWSWASETLAASEAILPLTASGLYTLTVSMREDGFRLDRLWLISDTLTIPSGNVPTASVMQTQTMTLQPVIEQTVSYTYDGLDRLEQATYVGTLDAVYSYRYDEVGNRTHYTETVTSGAAPVQVSNVYTYDVANRLTDQSEQISGEVTTYFYDHAGRLTLTILPSTHATGGGDVQDQIRSIFDQRGRMTLAEELRTENWVTQASYIYDGANRRLVQTVSGLSISYVFDYGRGGQRILFEDNGQETKHYLRYVSIVLGQPIQQLKVQLEVSKSFE
jgi:hypothetical protein